MHNTRVGVDLAKDVIQVCIYSNHKVISNTEMTTAEFSLWLVCFKPTFIVFEACGMSNYWLQAARKAGHDARLVSAKLVSLVRQNQKTDANDALAIVQTTFLPDVKYISGKSMEQQQLQSINRFRDLADKQHTALLNQISALLAEFNIKASYKTRGLGALIKSTLEDAENNLTHEFREALNVAWQQCLVIKQSLDAYNRCLLNSIEQHAECKRLLKLEGVGVINAINLYVALGCCDLGVFKKGKDASACIGVTPIQHSSGGKVKLGSIGKSSKNSKLRSQLILGAMSAVRQMVKRPAVTKKEAWVQELVKRRGQRCAAVALANKTIRTAFAMLTKDTEYKAELIAG
ncbi:MAG: transposase IS116/IS110/IS902 family protein [Osedax symbiont Rs1]|nr:MAG: transposase IS116/IS110/IS902 family protein [Osedax symbiont Rs1]